VLVNNAGAINGKRLMTLDGYELTFQANYLSPFLLTNLLLPVIKQSAPARIVNVSSMAHYMGHIDFDDLMAVKKYGEMRAYSQSKLANVLFTKQLAKTLEGSGVVTNALHPGVVHTGFAGTGSVMSAFFYKTFGFMMDTPEKGARTSMYVAASPEAGKISGEYFSDSRAKKPSPEARNQETAQKLWGISVKLTGLDKK
jgi:retinol dehydrogenase-12